MPPELPDRPAVDVLTVSTAAQFRGLSHPFRQRLLFALGQQPATISQLARSLSAPKGSVAHHLQVLHDGGLVELVATRQVRGGTERYYQRSARRLSMADNAAGPTAAMLGAVAEEIAAAPCDPLLNLRHVRLSAADARRLTATLSELVDGLADADEGADRFGVLVSVYQQAGPATDP